MKIDRYRVACALRVAAEQYKRDAHDAAYSVSLARHFEDQAREAFDLAEALEDETVDIVSNARNRHRRVA